MNSLLPQCSELSENVNNILDLIKQVPSIKQQETLAIKASLKNTTWKVRLFKQD